MDEPELITKEFKNNNGTDNHIGVVDEIGKEMLKEEREAYEEAFKNVEKDIENYEKQWKIDRELMQLQYDNFGMDEKKYTHKIHFVPRYWELEKEKFSYQIKMEEFKAEKFLEQKNIELEKAVERIAIIDKQLEEVEKRLGEIKND